MPPANNSNQGQPPKLEKLLHRANIPTLPAVAHKLIELCRDDDASFAQFAQIISSDQSLASRILRVANSAFYGLRTKAATLERAIAVLGLKYVRSICLGFQLVSSLSKLSASGFNMGDFWQKSLVRAVMARQLANRYCPQRKEEAFLIGLLQDSGIPILIQAFGDEYATLCLESHSSPSSFYQLERKLFDFDHIIAARILMERWSLPDIIAQPICNHHRRSQSQPSLEENVQLAQVAYFVGTLCLDSPNSFGQEDITLSEYCRSAFAMEKHDIRELVKQSQDEFSSISKFFGDLIPEHLDISKLLSHANEMLSDIVGDVNQEVFGCETEISRLKNECHKLTGLIDRYRRESQKDNLTGLDNHTMLMSHLDEVCPKIGDAQTTLTVIYIDIDHLDNINKIHSHETGDHVLHQLAGLLETLFRNNSRLFRCRDDEIVVAVTGMQKQPAIDMTETLIQKIHDFRIKKLSSDSESISLTCCIGMIFYDYGSKTGDSTEILESAYNQMRRAKEKGNGSFDYKIFQPATISTHNSG